jgi:hypothetical protein
MEPTDCSETSVFNIQTPWKYPEENIPTVRVTSCHVITSEEGIGKGCELKRSLPDLKYADTHCDFLTQWNILLSACFLVSDLVYLLCLFLFMCVVSIRQWLAVKTKSSVWKHSSRANSVLEWMLLYTWPWEWRQTRAPRCLSVCLSVYLSLCVFGWVCACVTALTTREQNNCITDLYEWSRGHTILTSRELMSRFTFCFQILPYFFPCVGSHMLISIIGWLGII